MVALSVLDNLSHAERLSYIRAHRRDMVGHILIGVLSTGIYCLPSCTAREPKAENVRFFETEGDAQAAGLRPCRRCRPDYFYQDYDPDFEKLTTLVQAMRHDPTAFSGLDAMAAASTIGVTKLHALFRQHYHTTPAAFLSKVKLAAACGLLANGDAQVIDVAYASGFESLSAFHDNFRKATGLSPKDYQRLGRDGNTFTISLPDDFLAWVPLRVLARDAESCIEQVDNNHAVKALTVGSGSETCTVLLHMDWQPDQKHTQQIECRVESAQLLDHAMMRQVHNAALRMLGFPINPSGFERLGTTNPDVARLIAGRQGLRIPQSADLFEGITWAIVGQQVNLAFAFVLRQRLAKLCGLVASDTLYAHPTAEAVAKLDYEDLTPLQFSRRKAEYLIDIARMITSGELVIDPFAPASQTEKQLMNIRGLGKWSVNYIMMRALGFADCVPLGDTGLTSALQRFYQLKQRPDSEVTDRLMKSFSPYRSLVTYHLWMTLGENPA